MESFNKIPYHFILKINRLKKYHDKKYTRLKSLIYIYNSLASVCYNNRDPVVYMCVYVCVQICKKYNS